MKKPIENIRVSLLDNEAKGGDIAEGGFKFQANLIVAQTPKWMSRDAFSEMIRESLGDAEAKFFSPRLGETREFIEYKNHTLTPSQFWPEIEHFYKMDQGAPDAYSRFTLISTGLSKSLYPVLSALRRVRDARPFYNGVDNITTASYDDFMRVVTEHGGTKLLGSFVFSKVYIEIVVDAEQFAKEVFRESLFKNYPTTENLSGKTINTIHRKLVELVSSRKNKPIMRHEIEQALWSDVKSEFRPKNHVRIHTIHESSGHKDPPRGPIILDWANLFGGENRVFPQPKDWDNFLIDHLRKTREWINTNNRPKHIFISGKMRLSACIALGSIFSSTAGYIISVENKDGIWNTNSYPDLDTPEYHWEVTYQEGRNNGEMVVGIGVIRDVSTEVEQYLSLQNFDTIPRLQIYGTEPLYSSQQINKAINDLKNIILKTIAENQIKMVHLFLATPAQFALFFGHRLNATSSIQCYERISIGDYKSTCKIEMK